MNTNSNSYTIAYAAVLVVIVAFLLAFISQALKQRQDDNVALDKKKQVLYSLNIRGLDDAAATAKYKEVVLADHIVNAEGELVGEPAEDAEHKGFLLGNADYKQGQLALFECQVDGETKWVIPVYGMGLWGGISGYVALNADKQTVFGAYFNHESETAGLGAEIKDSQAWQEKFQGKRIFAADSQDIALAVVKKVGNPETEVDAVTGATLTSDGVSLMLQDCLSKYVNFLTK